MKKLLNEDDDNDDEEDDDEDDDDDDNDEDNEQEKEIPNLSHLISYKDMVPINQITRYQGEKVRLFCLDYGFRPDGILKWKKNDVFYNLKMDKNAYINYFNEFVIEKLEFKHAGVYECLFDEKTVLEIDLKVNPLFMKNDKYDDNFEYEGNEDLFNLFIKITLLFLCIIIFRSINSVVSNLSRKNKKITNCSDLVKSNNFITPRKMNFFKAFQFKN